MMKKYRFEILLFFIYLLLALVWTWPLLLNFNSSIYGIRGDHFGRLWEDWWRKDALLSGKTLLRTPLVNAPFDYSYQSSTFQPLHSSLRFIVSLLTNEVFSLNIWLILSFPLSGLAVYLLVKKLTENKLAGAFSGLIYSFSMYHFSHAWEHSSLVFIFWIPFYVLSLVNFNEKKTIKNAIVAAALFAAVLLDNFYYGYFTFFFTVFFFLFQIRSWWSWSSLKMLLVFGLFCVLFSVPFILPTVKTLATGNVGGGLDTQAYQRSLHDLNWLSARPWYYILPSPWHPLWGSYSRKVLDWIATKPPYFLTQQYDGNEDNLYLTWTALILSGIAVIKSLALKKSSERGSGPRWVWVFLGLGIAMAIFSAPPMVTISLHKIYFPSHFLYNFFPMFRAYARFGVLVLLCVAVLAGFGLDYVLFVAARFYRARSWRHKMPQLLTVILSGIVLLEVLLPPFNVDLTPPEAYVWLKDQPGDFIVMEFPSRTDHSDVLYQRVHKKRLFDPRWASGREFLYSLVDQKVKFEDAAVKLIEFPNELKSVGVVYVIYHKEDAPRLSLWGNFSWEGYEVTAEFPDAVVYRIVGK